MNSSEVLSRSINVSRLEEAALNFVVSPKAFKLLEHHRAAVLTLRAKDASYSQIHDFLKEHHIFVSESSISRFCRKHRSELQRQRLLLEQEADFRTESSPGSKPTSSLSATDTIPGASRSGTRKIRDLRGEV